MTERSDWWKTTAIAGISLLGGMVMTGAVTLYKFPSAQAVTALSVAMEKLATAVESNTANLHALTDERVAIRALLTDFGITEEERRSRMHVVAERLRALEVP